MPKIIVGQTFMLKTPLLHQKIFKSTIAETSRPSKSGGILDVPVYFWSIQIPFFMNGILERVVTRRLSPGDLPSAAGLVMAISLPILIGISDRMFQIHYLGLMTMVLLYRSFT